MMNAQNKKIWAWSMYDWANSAFSTTVMAGFFPIFFEKYWSNPDDVIQSTYQLGMANALASIIIAAVAPFLGAIADRGSAKKKFLIFFCYLGVVMTSGLFIVGQGEWQLALMLFVAATVGFMGANIFYDSLLLSVSPTEKVDYVSSFGFALGYIGGGLLFLINVIMFLKPEIFGFIDGDVATLARSIREDEIAYADVQAVVAGLSSKYAELKTAFISMSTSEVDLLKKITEFLSSAEATAIKLSFFSVAVWWGLFTIPLMIFVPEPESDDSTTLGRAVLEGYQQMKTTFKHIRELKVIGIFLIAYWLYIDGVDTIIRMSVKIGSSLGFETGDLITALLMVQFIAFPAALAYNWFASKIGTKKAVLIAIGGYSVITLLAFFMTHKTHFFMLAALIGLFQGGIQALSRSLYARLVPKGKEAEFFGFYNMLGKFAAVIGPILIGWVTLATGNVRLGILSIIILFISGGYLLNKVDFEKGEELAKQFSHK
ncbi:MAG: MFS transporter [Candidatus Marinimicrobia bacterium]|nr:MFS transporter [Candidatus Neomarinimicrobiota bacterium]